MQHQQKNNLIFVFGVVVFRARTMTLSFQSSKLRTPPWNLFLALVQSHLITRESL
jgi:hypothetical protein